MPQVTESPASAMLKHCGAVVASLQASGDSTDHRSSFTPVGSQQSKSVSLNTPAVRPPLRLSQTVTSLIPTSHVGLEVTASQPQRQQHTSVLEQLLTHGKSSLTQYFIGSIFLACVSLTTFD